MRGGHGTGCQSKDRARIDIGCVGVFVFWLRIPSSGGGSSIVLELPTSCSNDSNPCLCVVWMTPGVLVLEDKRTDVTGLVLGLPSRSVCIEFAHVQVG